MADTEYTIEVAAEGIGTDATADEILALDKRMRAAEKVITRFDGALEAAAGHLAKATAASDAAASALGEAEAKYARLERAATAAAKKVEKAAAAGRDTTKLQAAATAAAAAVQKQAQAVDRASQEAAEAAAQQNKLARAYRNVEKAAERAAEETRGTERSFGDLFGAAGALGGTFGGLAGQISGVGDGLRAGGGKAGVILGAFAAANAFAFLMKAAIGLMTALAGATIGLLAFAVAADEATSKALKTAWEDAGKAAKKLFEGVKTEKLVKPVKSLLGLLDENTSAGKGLSTLIETLLNPLIDGIVEAAPLAKEFFKGMIIGALDVVIVILRLRNAIARAIPKETREKIKEVATEVFNMANAVKLGEGAFKVLAVVAFALAVVLGVVVLALVAIGLVIYTSIVQPIGLAIEAITQFVESLSDTSEKTQKAGEDAGKGLGEGIIAGIKAMVGKVVTAAGDMANQAIAAVKEKLKIKSPSRVMWDLFEMDVGGAAVKGLEAATPEMERAGESFGEAAQTGIAQAAQRPPQQLRQPSTAPTSSGTAAGKPGQAQVTMHLAPGAIVVQAPDGDGESIADAIRRVLLAEVDGAALQLGGGELVAGTT